MQRLSSSSKGDRREPYSADCLTDFGPVLILNYRRCDAIFPIAKGISLKQFKPE
jgi:hypothetical protein